MRQSLARLLRLISAALLAGATALPARASVDGARAGLVAAEEPAGPSRPAGDRPPAGDTQAPPADGPSSPRDDTVSGTGPNGPRPDGPALAAAPTPEPPLRPGTGTAGSIGHFRIYEHPGCTGDPCSATISDLDSRQRFEASVSLAPLHLAAPLEGLARSAQIELLVSGELRVGRRGVRLRALHLEGVTPHAALPDSPHPKREPALPPTPPAPNPAKLLRT